MSKKKPITFVIVDGLGIGSSIPKPYQQYMVEQNSSLYSHTLLYASRECRGLLPTMPGNSMAGHFTLGSGRIVKQPITLLTESLRAGIIPHYDSIAPLFKKKDLHICALLSQSGVHGTIETLIRFVEQIAPKTDKKIIIHAILDGRDSPPQSAAEYLLQIDNLCNRFNNLILGSIAGRFYALDRDQHHERTTQYVSMLTGQNESQINQKSWRNVIAEEYLQISNDQFITPTLLTDRGTLKPDDGILIFITRADRARSLLRTLQKGVPAQIITATDYGIENQPPFLLPAPHAKQTLCEQLDKAGYRIFSIAESEKYAHITYFFNGGREIRYTNETRIVIPSHSLKSDADRPEMRAHEITDHVIDRFGVHDFFLINYANADMIGHTGDSAATELAIAVITESLKKLEQITLKHDGIMIITSDHGNAEAVVDGTTLPKTVHTMHTNAPVPLITISNRPLTIPSTLYGLADVAPWLLTIINEPVPSSMIGSHDILDTSGDL